MKLFLGYLKNSRPQDSRIFADHEGILIDLRAADASYLAQTGERSELAYELADLYFPRAISDFLQRGRASTQALSELVNFLDRQDLAVLRGPSGERLLYRHTEIRVLPPVTPPEKTLIIGFSDNLAQPEKRAGSLLPTAFYKIPSTFLMPGEAIRCPDFSRELNCNACMGVVIGKPGRRIPRERAWEYVGGVTLLIDVTARDISRRESLTRNNLLAKNFPFSTPIGPALFIGASRDAVEKMQVELSLDGRVRQKFTLKDLMFSVDDVIAHWSMIGLGPGDILGLGANLAPQEPVAIGPGSVLRCQCPEIGDLSCAVVPGQSAMEAPGR